MKKHNPIKLSLKRESIVRLEAERAEGLGAVRGLSGEDCSSQFRNCPATFPTL